MTTVLKAKQHEDGSFINTLAHEVEVETSLGKTIAKDWFYIRCDRELTDEDVASFDPKKWVIRENTFINEETGEELHSKWLVSEIQ